MTDTFYERVGPVEMCLSMCAVDEALGALVYAKPTLYVHPKWVGVGHQIAARYNLNLELHGGESEPEWFIEWNGRRVGSTGC